jgi:hypothetical protein
MKEREGNMTNLAGSPNDPPLNKNLRLVFPEGEKDTILIMDGDKVVKEVHHEMFRQMLQLSESDPDSENRKIGHALFAQILSMPDTKLDPSGMGRLMRFGPPPRP